MIALLACLSAASAVEGHVALGASVIVHEARPAAVVGLRLWRIDLRSALGARMQRSSWLAHSSVMVDLAGVSDHDHMLGVLHSTEQLPSDSSFETWHRLGVGYAYHAPRGLLLEVSGWAPTSDGIYGYGVGGQIGWVFKIRPRRAAARHLKRR